MADPRARRGGDSGLGVLPAGTGRDAPGALLFRQTRGDAAPGSGKTMRDLNLLPDLELALIQSELDWHDAPANRARFAPLLAQAPGADLVMRPEMFSTGFSMRSAELAEPEEGPT